MPAAPSSIYKGACDTSAAVRLPGTTLFVAATDEDSVLRVYDLQNAGLPVSSTDLTAFIKTAVPDEEADIEGAAQIGDLIFWITSHGLNSKGITEEGRRRLFATSVSRSEAAVELRPFGTPYTNLLRDLLGAQALSGLGLQDAIALAPEAPKGFNLEGLAPAGDGLLIGFRNPIPDGKAIVVRLHNPAALVRGEAKAADLSLAGLLELGGRGIRALEFLPDVGMYLVIAGAFDDQRDFRVFVWSGGPEAPIALDLPNLNDLNPEEIVATVKDGGSCELQLFSDDGDALIGEKKCKKVKDTSQRTFRMHTIVVQLPTSPAS